MCVTPANHFERRRDRRLAANQSGKRRAVVIIRERDRKFASDHIPWGTRSISSGACLSRFRLFCEPGLDQGLIWNRVTIWTPIDSSKKSRILQVPQSPAAKSGLVKVRPIQKSMAPKQ
jgi:hypothetical protein